MSKYGSFKYGTDVYGDASNTPPPSGGGGGSPPPPPPPPPPPGGASGSDATLVGIPSAAYQLGIDVQPLVVKAMDYGFNLCTWKTPGDNVSRLVLVRNASGYPGDESDGVVLYSGAASTINRFEDRTVLPGQDYFYAIYLLLTQDAALQLGTMLVSDPGVLAGTGPTLYIPGAIARCTAVQDFDSTGWLLNHLPRMYTSPGQDAVGEIDTTSQLARFLKIFAFELDRIRTDLKNVWPFHRAISIPGPMVPHLATMLGQNLEFGIGYRQTRVLARDSVYISSRKGSTAGINAFGKALTGLGVKAVPGPNLLFDANDASFEGANGRWAAVTNCAITRDTSNANSPQAPASPAPALPGGFSAAAVAAIKVTSSAAGAMTVRFGGTSQAWGVPVTAGNTYAVSAFAKTAVNGRTVTFAVEWRDATGSLLSTSTQSPGTTDTTTYARLNYIATAPANAAYASITVTWSTPAAGTEIHYLDTVQFESLSLPVPDSDMEATAATTPWVKAEPGLVTTMSLDTSVKNSGTQSLKLVCTAAGQDAYATQTVKVWPGRTYTVAAYVRVTAFTSGAASNRGIYLSDGAGTTANATITGTNGSFTQQSATITPTTSNLEVRLYAPQGTVYWDDVTMVLTAVTPYEDARMVDLFVFPDRRNFCANPNFEASSVGWSATTSSLNGYSGSTTIARSTAQHKSGTASLLVTHPTTTKSGVTTTVTDLTPGQAYTVSAQVYLPAGSPTVAIEHDAIPFVNRTTPSTAAQSVLVSGTGKSYALSITDAANLSEGVYPEQAATWCRVFLTFVASKAVHTVGFYATSTTAGQTCYLDEVMVEPTTDLRTYFDGSTSPDCDWEATANLSRSSYIRNKTVKTKRLYTRVGQELPQGIPYAVRLAYAGL